MINDEIECPDTWTDYLWSVLDYLLNHLEQNQVRHPFLAFGLNGQFLYDRSGFYRYFLSEKYCFLLPGCCCFILFFWLDLIFVYMFTNTREIIMKR